MLNGNEIPDFGKRLKYLIGKDNCYKRGISQIIAEDMIKKGLIEPDEGQTEESCISSSAKSIRNHLKCQSFDSVGPKWISVYAHYFNCSADFLLGFINAPTHRTNSICDTTGLSISAAELLQKWTNEGYNEITELPKVLSDLITHDDFPKMLNYIMKLANARNPETEQIEKQKTYANLSGIEETESAVSQSFKDRADVAWMRATNIFQNIINDISD